jgi:hypothetical protein
VIRKILLVLALLAFAAPALADCPCPEKPRATIVAKKKRPAIKPCVPDTVVKVIHYKPPTIQQRTNWTPAVCIAVAMVLGIVLLNRDDERTVYITPPKCDDKKH